MLKIIRKIFSFGDFSRSRPNEQIPGDMLDAQFDEILNQVDAWTVDVREATLQAEIANVKIDQFVADAESDAGQSEAWAKTSQLWAEHMPDTIPNSELADTDITGDHWSSRWWANEASQIVQTLGGADIGPTPPSPPIPPGRFFWESDTNNLYIWYDDGNSQQWVQVNGGSGSGSDQATVIVADVPPDPPLKQGQLWWSSTTGNLHVWFDDGDSKQFIQIATNTSVSGLAASLYYTASDGQTAFPVTVPDRFGKTSVFSALSTIHVIRSGTRLVPTDGFSAASNVVTLAYPAGVGEPVSIDIWGPL